MTMSNRWTVILMVLVTLALAALFFVAVILTGGKFSGTGPTP